ncbi:hypothetical protein HXX76_011246 [Chlamydomonas incerta]|uniref:mRNA export factor GLE1 n=1 Tax=Chlamydomonas incerta TaxID=51695 RepID=A0A835SST2_CHLIN|nr:hypothetical protein HXX76_011246 [Chlamydomonas incerta]|eukprot:KAG2429003.1 hypothetical protein HXX76_011246 [Chlamydomonas incerta]
MDCRKMNYMGMNGGAAPAAWGHPAVATRPYAVEEQRQLVEQQLLLSLEAVQSSKQALWRQRLVDLESQLAAKLNVVASTALRKQDDLARADQELLRAAQQRRNEELEKVQRSHRTEASLQEQQIKRLMEQREEERRKEEERKRREEEERRREAERQEAERERARKEAEASKARQAQVEADKKRAEADAAAQKAEAAAKAKKAAASAASKAHPCLRVSAGAAEQAEQLAARLAELQASIKPLTDDEGTKKARRDIEKKLTVHVQQISGTQNQVAVKCQDVYNLLSGVQGPWRAYAVLTFANKIIKQQELVQLNNKAAFPLAQVAVKISSYFPELLDALLGLIQKSMPLAVPQAYVHDAAQITNNAYYRGMGFEELDDPAAPSGKVFESPDEYLKRLEGLLLLYAAVMQVDEPNRFGVAYAWSWVARCLNSLPADRYTAKALVAVLRVAGFSLFTRYRGQFVKLMGTLRRDFLPALRATAAGDDLISAFATLLESYVDDGVFRRPPEGRNMPAFDISSRPENRA